MNGTKFFAQVLAAVQRPDPEAPIPSPPRIRVLLVVDDAETKTAMCTHLRSSGDRFEVDDVSSLHDALVRLRDEDFDAALVDLELPEAEWRDVLQRIRVVADVVPIIALHGEAQDALTVDVVRTGAQDCVSRREPDATAVTRAVEHAVERHRRLLALHQARAKEHHDATHDPLTDLPNRQAFDSALSAAIASARRHQTKMAVLFLDLDGFKAVNDSLGHDTGDALLTEMGRRLRRVTRRSDLVARLGGDEFAVALRDCGEPREAMRAAEHFIEAIAAPVPIRDQTCHVGVSIGVAFLPGDGETPETLLRSADTAMYCAKQMQGNSVRFYQQAMDREMHERFELVVNLREATAREELFLEYQPQIDTTSQRLVGAEALLRWQHPTRGRLAPSQFLALAEDTGRIHEIGRFALREACRAAASWGDGADAPTVAVNVSRQQLARDSLADDVRDALREADLPPRRLVLDVSEHAMFDPAGSPHRSLRRLVDTGVGLAVHRYGTRTSSLAVLHWDGIRELKLDGSLLEGLCDSEHRMRAVEALLSFGRLLGLEVVAVGVETTLQLRVLKALGARQVQGFLLGDPISAEQLRRQIDGDEKAPWREVLSRDEPPLPGLRGLD